MTLRSRLLGLLLVASLALAAVASPGHAGSATAPEITDPAGDQIVADTVPIGEVDAAQFSSADIVAGWITADATNLYLHIQVSGTGADSTTTQYAYTFHVTAGGTALTPGATAEAEGTPPTPVAPATAAALDAGVITLTVPRTAFGAATSLTAIHVTSEGDVAESGAVAATDIAPDDGADAALAYSIPGSGGGGGGGSGNPNDTDGDGLNNTFEQTYFNNATSPQTGAGDGDADGLNNTQEQAAGTDPTKADTDGDTVKDGDEVTAGTDPKKADTDGDGASDGAEKQAGTDPKDPNSKPSAGTGTPTGTGTGTPSSTTSATSTSSTSADSDDPLGENMDYLAISAGGFAVVLILSLIALFGRWGA